MYKISVIIPIYNAEKDLTCAVDSIINQTIGFNNVELILVDDKSTDGSKRIIEDYARQYDNIKAIFLEKNSGLPGKPRNVGLENASSQYIIFLDADDEYLPHALERYYDAITRENSDFLIASHYINLDGDMVKVNLIPSDNDNVSFNPLENQEVFDKLSYNHLVAPWGKIFNRNLLIKNNIRFPEDSLCEDTYFYFKALINSSKVTFLLKEYLYVYNTFENKKTAIHGHDMKKFNNFLRGMNYTNGLLEDIHLSKDVFYAENISALLLIFSNLSKQNKKQAINEVYDFEKDLNVQIPRVEISILNNFILKRTLLEDFR